MVLLFMQRNCHQYYFHMVNCRPISDNFWERKIEKGAGFRVYMKIIFMQMAGMSTVYGINSLVRTVDLKLNSPFVCQKSLL